MSFAVWLKPWVHVALGTSYNDGAWHYLDVDLETALQTHLTTETIQTIHGLRVRCNDLYLDDIVLSRGGEAPYVYEWDAMNRLTKVSEGDETVAEYVYDATNRRVRKDVAGTANDTGYPILHKLPFDMAIIARHRPCRR